RIDRRPIATFSLSASVSSVFSVVNHILFLPGGPMHSRVCEYELTDSFDIPEITPVPSIRSERARTVAKWFGIDDRCDDRAFPPREGRASRAMLRSLLPLAGQITFLTGPSGAGKSSLLRALRALRPRARWVDLDSIELPDLPLVDC